MFHEALTPDSREKPLKKYSRVMGRPERDVRRNSATRSRYKSRHKRDPIVSLSLFPSFLPPSSSLCIVSPVAGRKSNSVLFGRIYTGIRYSERSPRHIKIERAQ